MQCSRGVLAPAITLTLLAAAATREVDAPSAPLLPFTERLQRIAVAAPPARLSVEVLPLGRRVLLSGPLEVLTRLSRTVRPGPAAVCAPTAPPAGKVLVLRCSTALLHAQLEPEGAGAVLVLRQLRSVPFVAAQEAPPPFEVPAQADPFDDLPSLRAVADSDAALLAGDPIAAMAALKQVKFRTSIGRLASMRRAELDGSALAGPLNGDLWDTSGMPPAWSTDLQLHQLRVLGLRGEVEEAVALLRAQPSLCAAQRALCLSVLWRGLEDDRDAARLEALTAYAALALEDRSALGLWVAPVAARVAADSGAPGWAARLLASRTPQLPRDELEPHLLTVASYFAQAKDQVRLAAVLDYAQTRFPAALSQRKDWRRLSRLADGSSFREPPPPPLPATEARALTDDLAASALARARARSTP